MRLAIPSFLKVLLDWNPCLICEDYKVILLYVPLAPDFENSPFTLESNVSYICSRNLNGTQTRAQHQVKHSVVPEAYDILVVTELLRDSGVYSGYALGKICLSQKLCSLFVLQMHPPECGLIRTYTSYVLCNIIADSFSSQPFIESSDG